MPQPCPSGQYSEQPGQRQCLNCNRTSRCGLSPWSKTSGQPQRSWALAICPPGTYRGGDGDSTCLLCSSGRNSASTARLCNTTRCHLSHLPPDVCFLSFSFPAVYSLFCSPLAINFLSFKIPVVYILSLQATTAKMVLRSSVQSGPMDQRMAFRERATACHVLQVLPSGAT